MNAHMNLKKHHLQSCINLLREAADIIQRLPEEVFDQLEVWHYLADELKGSANMLEDVLKEQ